MGRGIPPEHLSGILDEFVNHAAFAPCLRCKGARVVSDKPCTLCKGSGFRIVPRKSDG